MGVLFQRVIVVVIVGVSEGVDVGVGEALGFFGEVAVFEDVDFGAGDAAAVYGFDLQAGVDVEGCRGVTEDFLGDACVQEGAEEHVAGDAGEAV